MKKKKSCGKVVSLILYLLVGVVLGVYTGIHDLLPDDATMPQAILFWAIALLIVYAAVYVQLIIHELGHLIFGLLSGYQFCSFRIASLTWVREDGRLRLKKYALAGTGGQCLMEPPEMVNGRIPVFLYNMGGAIANLIASTLALGLWALCARLWHADGLLGLLLLMLALMGVVSAASNGIPMSFGLVDNDGRNALCLRKDPQAMRAFWIQLKSNALSTRGVDFTEMPEEWFELPSAKDMQNPLAAWLGALAIDRLMAQHRLEDAALLIDRLLEEAPALDGVNRNLLVCARIYCEILGECRADVIAGLRDKKQIQFMNAMKNNPAVLCAEYTYALLLEKDARKAAKLRRNFDRIAEKYPYPQQIKTIREQMQLADQKAENQ